MTKEHEAAVGLDLDLNKDQAIKRIAKVTEQEQVEGNDDQYAMIAEGESQIALFKGTAVRQVFHDGEWFFSIVDVVEAVTESDQPARYWNELKSQLSDDEGFSELFGNIEKLKMPGANGKMYETESVNVETLFRVVQSIPSKKAEPFKRWLAKVGYERIQEIQNPEIGVKRAILQWQVDGRSDDWINARIRSIVTRKELTLEWKNRGIKDMEYGVLTNAISKETFGVTPDIHKKMKGLKNHNLRDHMTDLELIFTMLGEKSTTAIAVSMNSQGFDQNLGSAKAGGKVAGDARRELEKKIGKRVISQQNFLKGKERALDPEKLTSQGTDPVKK